MGRRKKRRTVHAEEGPAPDLPKSIVVRKGNVSKSVSRLAHDLRKVMLPWTAMKLKETKKNVIRDFVAVATPLGVSHIIALSQKGSKVFIEFCRMPRGPTITFQILNYSLNRDIVNMLQRDARTNASDYAKSPLAVLHGFKTTGEEQLLHLHAAKLMLSTLFPQIDPSTVTIEAAQKRVVLFDHVGDGVVEWRHYATLKDVPGMNPALSRVLLRGKSAASLEELSMMVKSVKPVVKEEIDEAEVAKGHVLTLPAEVLFGKQKVKAEDPDSGWRGSMIDVQIKLVELGPRISMKLVGISDSLFGDEFEIFKDLEEEGKHSGEEDEAFAHRSEGDKSPSSDGSSDDTDSGDLDSDSPSGDSEISEAEDD